jgi:hypothetical protein
MPGLGSTNCSGVERDVRRTVATTLSTGFQDAATVSAASRSERSVRKAMA